MGETVTEVCLWFTAFGGGNSTCLTYCPVLWSQSKQYLRNSSDTTHAWENSFWEITNLGLGGESEHAAGEQICMTHFSHGEMTVYEMKAYNEYFFLLEMY